MSPDVLPQVKELGKLLSLALLPEEIMIEILLWLPLQSILRFKCTCKSWKTLFSDPGFSELHLQRAIATKKKCILLRHLSIPSQDFSLHADNVIECRRALNRLVSKGQTCHELEETYSLLSNRSCEEIGRVEVPIESKPSYYTIIDSSNGIVCLTDSTFDGSSPLLEVFLWNPSTGELETLPSYFENRYDGYVIVSAYGFAFHPVLGDYFIVRIMNHFDENSYTVEMYSLRDELWKTVPDVNIVCRFHDSVSQAFVNGALHWVASKGENIMNPHFFILSFDTRKEEFSELSLPEGDYTMDEFLLHKSQTSSMDSLSLIVCKIYQGFEVWVLTEYGIAASWLKQRWIQCPSVEIMKPLHVFEDEKMIMEMHGNEELVLCNSNFQIIHHLHALKPVRIVNHLESQVSLRQWRREIEI